MEITDAHFHLWAPKSHSWLKNLESLKNHPAGDLSPMSRDYNVKEFLSESKKYKIDKSVHIQCYHDDAVEETKYLQEIANKHGHPHGIIAYVELEKDNVEEILKEHLKFKNFRGVRQCLDYHPKFENRRLCPSPYLMMDKKFHHGLNLLSKYNLIFDMQLYPSQMLNASVLVAAHSNLRFVINHAGFPLAEDISIWKEGIKLLSRNKNVFIKLSGFSIFLGDINKQAFKFVVLYVIENFGVDRVMFASDFPVDKIHAAYDTYYDIFYDVLQNASFSKQDIQKMFHDNAIRVYKLNENANENNAHAKAKL